VRPPKDIKPAVLFRMLIRRPRPKIRIDHRIYLLGRFELWAHALTSEELNRAMDEGGIHEVAARSIFCNEELAFNSGEEIRLLETTECGLLMDAFAKAFGVICPSLVNQDSNLWRVAMSKGVQAPSNFSIVVAMSECCDMATGVSLIRNPRPERYYGLPMAELTDGQRMAFSAANKLVNDQIEADSKE
jgi:hypothetical protein